MKNIGYISILILLLLQSGGMLVIYKIMQVHARYEMHEQMMSERTDFQNLRLSIKDYHNSKINAHEISFQGKMYDVKSVRVVNDEVELQVIHDTIEGGILMHINDLVNDSRQPDRKIPNGLLGIVFLLYVPANTSIFQDIAITFQKNNFNDFTSLVSSDPEIPSPPPRWV